MLLSKHPYAHKRLIFRKSSKALCQQRIRAQVGTIETIKTLAHLESNFEIISIFH